MQLLHKTLTLVGCAILLLAPFRVDAAKTAKEILDSIDDMWRGASSASIIRMEVKTAHWHRTLRMQSYSLGKDYSLIMIRLPKKERGTATLKVKQQIWNYLPKVNRTVKVPPSMLASSWMGSHFTNDDLVKESRMTEDYTFKITFTGKRAGEAIYEITLTPKPKAPVVWGKVIVEVRQKDYMPTVERYYDEQGKLVRTATFADFSVVDGKPMFKSMKMVPKDKQNEFTAVTLEKIQFNLPLKADFFTLKNLQRQ